MKRLIFIFAFLVVCSAIQANARGIMTMCGAGVPAASCADSSCSGYSGCQNFEGTGYDNSESWSTSGTVDPDYTTTVLRGSQSCSIADSSSIYRTGYTSSEMYWFGRFRFADATPSSAAILLRVVNSPSDVGWVGLLTNGKLYVQHGSSTNGGETTLSNDTTYFIWGYFKAATSAGADDGIARIWLSTTRTKPGTTEAALTNGTDDDDTITQIRISGGGGMGLIVDQVLYRSTEIGDVCE